MMLQAFLVQIVLHFDLVLGMVWYEIIILQLVEITMVVQQVVLIICFSDDIEHEIHSEVTITL